jgi:hypothetical protein
MFYNHIRCSLFFWLLFASFFANQLVAQRQGITTANFVVYSSDPAFSQKVAAEAERFRKELAELWLGYELKQWNQRCPIEVVFEPHAGGVTQFGFMTGGNGTGEPCDWSMKIFGPPDRLLDSVLPHEITHTVFATHFGCPLPRWADEGACTTVEHQSEKSKSHNMLIQFLKSRRGIPFNQMFVMRDYPSDILPLYAQGHSVAKFLIQKNGRRHFIDFVGYGMELERRTNGRRTAAWDQAIEKYYGFDDLSDLQVTWQSWVANGSPAESESIVAAQNQQSITDTPATLNHPRKSNVGQAELIAGNSYYNGDAKVAQFPRQDEKRSATTGDAGWYHSQQHNANRVPQSPAPMPVHGHRNDDSDSYRPGSIGKVSSIEELRIKTQNALGETAQPNVLKASYSTGRHSTENRVWR